MTKLKDKAEIRILIIGDVMVDRYIIGNISRISPEAPVPVLLRDQQYSRLGGAANVALNVAALGAKATLISVTGHDVAGVECATLLKQADVEAHLVHDRHRKTTVKTRYISGSHQVLRVDDEDIKHISEEISLKIIEHASFELARHDLVVLSDYNKGVLNEKVTMELIRIANSMRVDIIVDPKKSDFSLYSGASVITPNIKELSSAVGQLCHQDSDVEEASRKAQAITQSAIVTTRAENGMTVLDRSGQVTHIKTDAAEVYDVSGAGDTVVAALAITLSSGQSLTESAKIANIAAGIAVSKVGTAAVTEAELDDKIRDMLLPQVETDIAAIMRARRQWKRRSLIVGFTNGCFDILHDGHTSLLEFCRRNCDRLIVGLNSDDSVKRLKGQARPINNQLSRMAVLKSLKWVDEVVIFDEDTPERLIAALQPDVLVKGADYEGKKIAGSEFVEQSGGRVLLAPLVKGRSTSNLIAEMRRTG